MKQSIKKTMALILVSYAACIVMGASEAFLFHRNVIPYPVLMLLFMMAGCVYGWIDRKGLALSVKYVFISLAVCYLATFALNYFIFENWLRDQIFVFIEYELSGAIKEQMHSFFVGVFEWNSFMIYTAGPIIGYYLVRFLCVRKTAAAELGVEKI